jgi:regulator of protease activity HflC (stomatin/prohibitin superfamily)
MKHLYMIILIMLFGTIGCSRIVTEPGNETVIILNPWFFGHGGVAKEVQTPGAGWYAWSTHGIDIPTAPIKYDEPLEHLATNDNNFINYASYIVLQWSDAAENANKFGVDSWYENNLKEQYRTIVRDVTKQYQMTAIMTDPETLQKIESEVARKFNAHIVTTGLHVKLLNVNMGTTGCTPRSVTVARYDGVTDVREISGGYITYKIENGTVTCREHSTRSELTCWKN